MIKSNKIFSPHSIFHVQSPTLRYNINNLGLFLNLCVPTLIEYAYSVHETHCYHVIIPRKDTFKNGDTIKLVKVIKKYHKEFVIIANLQTIKEKHPIGIIKCVNRAVDAVMDVCVDFGGQAWVWVSHQEIEHYE